MKLELYEDPELDFILASGLSALAPDVDAVDATLAELRPRFHRARTRRRVAQASGAIAALLVVGSAAFAGAPSVRRSHVTVESPARPGATTVVPKRNQTPTTVRPHPKAKPAMSHATVPATNPHAPSSVPRTSAAPRSGVVPPRSPTSSAPVSTGTAAAPRKAAAAPLTRHYSSSGGSIAVRFANGRMQLVGVDAAKGYVPARRAVTPQLIDVRFTRHGRSVSEIELRVINGRMVRTESESWTSSGISAVSPSPPRDRAASRSPRRSPGRREGHGPARLLGFRTALSNRVPRDVVAHARRAGKHGAPRHHSAPVDE